MRKNLTELVFILDRSGSMCGLEADTIGGFNSMIEKQKREPGEALVSTVLFDHESTVLHDRVPLGCVAPMTARDYSVRGSTALFVITTDGMENASHRYDADMVKHMIERQKTKYKWEFLFLGANIDAAETAGRFGIDESHAVNYHSDHKGTQLNYEVLSDAVSAVRASAPLGDNWKSRIDEDFRTRNQND